MADKKVTDLTELTTPAAGDFTHLVDVSDTTDSASGTSKKSTLQKIADWLASLTQTLTNKTISDSAMTGINYILSPRINTFSTALTSTSDELNLLDGMTAKATAATVATGTSDAELVTPLSVAPYANSSMSRQAIMNGNFDVWQRGTSVALADVTATFLADRWRDYIDKNGGTLPTLTRSRQLLTSGDIPNAFYYTRLNTNGAGTSLGATSTGSMHQLIEHGTRLLCGLNKTVTVSFWARSDIANKKLGLFAIQGYGTTGSPSALETINGTNWTLTSTWTKYTHTFTTNTLVGKSFGTDNNDSLQIYFAYMWGSDSSRTTRVGASGAETYVGSGNIDIAQVQLCAGDVALPFQPKSFEEELRACLRYCFVPETPGTSSPIAMGYAASTTAAVVQANLPTKMRISPTLESATAADWVLSDGAGAVDVSALIVSTNTTNQMVRYAPSVGAGLTQFRPYTLQADGTANRLLVLTAEL